MMSFPGDLRHAPMDDGSDPLQNLSKVHARVDALQKFLAESVNSNTLIGKDQMAMVSDEITAAIHQIIVNGSALLTQTQTNRDPVLPQSQTPENPKVEEGLKDGGEDDYEIIELDAVELLAEHVHFCEICGKGFKRDANLRMHMRAHGDQFKTLEALSKPEKTDELVGIGGARARFSCPFAGCNRNKKHKKFRPLKSVVCVKNHFKRSHCPKMYSCTRCNKKSFSVLADLKSHLKHCGESRWKCCCGTSFSRKDKLFGHMALFEGHMPEVMVEEEEEAAAESKRNEVENGGASSGNGLMEGFGSVGNYDGFQEMLDSPPLTIVDGWFVQ